MVAHAKCACKITWGFGMKILLLAALALIVQLFIFLCVGSVVMRVRGEDNYSLSRACLLGYLVYFGIFEVICLICEIRLVPLSTLSYITAALCAAAVACGIFAGHRGWAASLRTLKYRIRLHGAVLIPVLIAVAATAAFVLLYYDASADSGWYVGTSSTALATDTIGRFDPSTGTLTLRFNSRYALSCYPYHSAAVCFIVRGLPVIVQARSVMSVINVLMSCTAVYYLGRAFFYRKPSSGAGPAAARTDVPGAVSGLPEAVSRRRADIFVLFVTVINLLSCTIYMPGIFLYSRSYEGKSLIVNVILVCALVVCVRLWREDAEEYAFRDLFWAAAAGVCFSGSVIMFAVLTAAALIPLIAIRGRWNLVIPFILGNLPVITWAAAYYLIQHGTIVLRTWR